jgi:hypothetical protein
LKLHDFLRIMPRHTWIHYQAGQESHFCQTSLY